MQGGLPSRAASLGGLIKGRLVGQRLDRHSIHLLVMAMRSLGKTAVLLRRRNARVRSTGPTQRTVLGGTTGGGGIPLLFRWRRRGR